MDVVVFAPAAEAAAFDDWGRPLIAAWENWVLVVPEFERHVQLCPDRRARRRSWVVRGSCRRLR